MRRLTEIVESYKKIKKFGPWIFLLFLLLPSFWWLLGSGYFIMHDDLQVMRLFQMEKCIRDLQIPCRWSPDMVYGYGQAMFNFYSAFPYYLGIIYKLLLGATYIGSTKFLFAFSLIGAGVGMYLLAKEFWGYWGGIIAAVLYTYAPYHAVDIYVRGALAESFALGILPFVWLFIYKVIIKPSYQTIFLLAFSLFVLFTTHNISMLIYAPFTVFWLFYWLKITKNFKRMKQLVISGVLGFGLAAFFILPAILEQNLVETKYLITDYSEYSAHFVSLYQLFISRLWDDGGSIFGTNDGMSFAVGLPHYLLIFILTPLAIWWYLRKKKLWSLLIILLVFFVFSTFLAHQRSVFIWKVIPMMKFIQFPWRFLGPSMFFISFAGGAIGKINFVFKTPLVIIVTILTFLFNGKYFTPLRYSRLVIDSEKLSGLAFELQQKGGYLDYLPKGVKVPPQATAPFSPRFIKGKGEIKEYEKKTNKFGFNASAYENSEIVLPIIYFPRWEIFVDGLRQEIMTDGAHNVIKIDLKKGEHEVVGKFKNTPVRSFANFLSFITFILLISYYFCQKVIKRSAFSNFILK